MGELDIVSHQTIHFFISISKNIAVVLPGISIHFRGYSVNELMSCLESGASGCLSQAGGLGRCDFTCSRQIPQRDCELRGNIKGHPLPALGDS